MRILIVLFTLLLSGGCTHLDRFQGTVQRMNALEMALLETDHAQGILQCVGRQLEYFHTDNGEKLIVGVYPFLNKSLSSSLTPQDVPMDATSILMASLNQISPLITYSDLLEVNDAIQHSTLSALSNNIKRPQIFLKGSILIQERQTQADSTSLDVGLALPLGSIRYSRKTADSIAGIEIDLNATTEERTSHYGFSAPVRILFDRSDASQDTLAVSIEEVALGGEKINRYVQSYGPALRMAIGLQLTRIIGRWQGLPYWSCLPSRYANQEDAYVKRRYQAIWDVLLEKGGTPAAIGWLQKLLVYNGYSMQPSQQLDGRTASALQDFMLKFSGRRFDPNNLFNAAWSLVQGIPYQSEATIKTARAWEKTHEQSAYQSPKQHRQGAGKRV